MSAGTTSFDPTDNIDDFRTALGSFVTGVTVVTTDSPEGPVGITANSFASVSLDPPLVLWSAAKSSKRFEHFVGSRRFAIHILASDQKDICDGFTQSKTAFNDIEWHESGSGIPLITGALATFECNLEATHDAGDHAIVVGRVTRAHFSSGAPLVFKGGVYGTFQA